jgi:hypothetical protein
VLERGLMHMILASLMAVRRKLYCITNQADERAILQYHIETICFIMIKSGSKLEKVIKIGWSAMERRNIY